MAETQSEIIIDKQNALETFNVGIVVSRFNEEITNALLDGALQRLRELDFTPHQITIVKVPGAVEIPFASQCMAKKGSVEAIITFGAVIRGETTHYDYVCEQASQGTQAVSLKYDLPVIFGVLTTENIEQARERVGGRVGHMGIEAVNAAVEMVLVGREFD